MKNRKSVWRFVLVIGILVSFSLTTMNAYLTDGDTANNAITVGGNNISIDEVFEPKPMTPGGTITKKVRIKNNGPNECYIRVRAVFSDSNVGKYANIDWNLKDWVYDATDEFYYYKTSVSEGNVTSWLMTTIRLNEEIPEEMIKDVELIIYAESYQSEGFSGYQEAWMDYQKNMK